MIDLKKIYKEFDNCECGVKHVCSVEDIEVYIGARFDVGKILKKNNFPKDLLVVCDKTTLSVSKDAIESLKDFNLDMLVYDDLRVATMDDVNLVMNRTKEKSS